MPCTEVTVRAVTVKRGCAFHVCKRYETEDEDFMGLALEEAERARERGEVPIGAVITLGGEILSRAHNSPLGMNDPSAHAEILAIRKAASRTNNYRLMGTTLYVTIEPCVMCAGAILHARIARVVYGAADPKGGAVISVYPVLTEGKLNHQVEVKGGVLARECGEILSRFFHEKRVHSPT